MRGWAKFKKGHGNAKVPAVGLLEAAPVCGCGCGEPVKFRNGKGWNRFKRGHDQRLFGSYRERAAAKRLRTPPPGSQSPT